MFEGTRLVSEVIHRTSRPRDCFQPLLLLAGRVAQRESPRTLSACVCVEDRGDPGYRFAQPGANVRAALPGCWFARRRREGN